MTVILFLDADGVLLVDFLDSGGTINGDYYASLLEQVRVAIAQMPREELTRGVRLLQDNAPGHKNQVAMTKEADCAFKLFSPPLYSPDLWSTKYVKAGLAGV